MALLLAGAINYVLQAYTCYYLLCINPVRAFSPSVLILSYIFYGLASLTASLLGTSKIQIEPDLNYSALHY